MKLAADELVWPRDRLSEAVELLASRSQLSRGGSADVSSSAGRATLGVEEAGREIELTAWHLGIEAESLRTTCADLADELRASGPMIIRVGTGQDARYLPLLGAGRRGARVLDPQARERRVPLELLAAELRRSAEVPCRADAERIAALISSGERRRTRAGDAILRERVAAEPIGGLWRLRPSTGGSFWAQLRHARFVQRAALMIGAYLAQDLLWILSWWLLGRGALEGSLDRGWLLGWGLILLSTIPLRALVTWCQGLIAVSASELVERRLLAGAQRMDAEEVRSAGIGRILGRVLESQATQSLALGGGFLALCAVLDLCLAAAVLASGAGSAWHALLLVVWLAVVLVVARRNHEERKAWVRARMAASSDLIEKMVGHRTRLAQQPSEHWHDGEDGAVEHHLELSRAMDRSTALLSVLAPNGWLLLGLLGLAPAFVAGSGSQAALAVGLGGVLLAYRAMVNIATGAPQLSAALIGWEEMRPVFAAAARAEPHALQPRSENGDAQPSDERNTLLEARGIRFGHRGRKEPVLAGVDLELTRGQKILLQGASGGGKSTLASVLAGLRNQDSGLLLLGGLDLPTVGSSAWRKRVALVPQFHENHLLSETLAFNLLMSRRWPPRAADLAEAQALCAELGLGELLERMPAGIWQMVGESGWQLSHGEKSRVFLARGLLQGAEIVVLDESLAALDPENLERTLQCVSARAPTLIVIAHP